MDKKYCFNKEWEVEYICARIRDISTAVEIGSYEHALDMLSMIQSKVERAKYTIENQTWRGDDV